MRKIIGLILVVLILVGATAFVRRWRSTTSLAAGTGDIAGKSTDIAARDQRPLGQKVRSKLRDITQNPARFQNQKVTLTGRVRGATKLASNRNIYTLTQDNYRLLVIDDKTPPREYWPRTVSGVVRVIGPPVGGLQYGYVVDVRNPARFQAPRWSEVEHFFTKKPNEP